ncbi:MAG: ParB N-terminal domain-containing protein [Selenomonadaceae bacterium]|nr:ParB N-terminal domain-containing protein [Selenomonadaceae bacterium]
MAEQLGGLASFVNNATKMAGKEHPGKNNIVYIPLEKLIPHEKNFYGLRDIDKLAGLISTSKYIEPLTVVEREDGNYTILSGHRRRAAIATLVESENFPSEVPCIVQDPQPFSVEKEDGEIVNFSAEDMGLFMLIAANRGQRDARTLEEQREEIRILEPLAEAIYAEKKKSGFKGAYREFFAGEILSMSQTQLHRLQSVDKLTDSVRQAVNEGLISESAAFEMATLPAEEQDSMIEAIRSGNLDNSIKAIKDERKRRNSKLYDDIEEEDEDEEEEETDEDEDEDDSDNTDLKDLKNQNVENQSQEENKGETWTSPDNEAPNSASDSNSSNHPQNRREEQVIPAEKSFKERIKSELPAAPKEEPDDPQKEAEEWFKKSQLIAYQTICDEAEYMKNELDGVDPVQSAQWGIRSAVAMFNLAALKNEGK